MREPPLSGMMSSRYCTALYIYEVNSASEQSPSQRLDSLMLYTQRIKGGRSIFGIVGDFPPDRHDRQGVEGLINRTAQ